MALVPGGEAKIVTNENRILYAHMMADYRLNRLIYDQHHRLISKTLRQIKQQSMAFMTGFRSVIDPSWLSLFSAPELQKLISGTNEKIDVDDLKKYVEYIGGYHSGHRVRYFSGMHFIGLSHHIVTQVIKWLWEVVAEDLDAKEQRLFLRFVTSCSRPPILGFQTLEVSLMEYLLAPLMYIHSLDLPSAQSKTEKLTIATRWAECFSTCFQEVCVLLAASSVGFSTVGADTERLPSSSTCFNLLKLPIYRYDVVYLRLPDSSS